MHNKQTGPRLFLIAVVALAGCTASTAAIVEVRVEPEEVEVDLEEAQAFSAKALFADGEIIDVTNAALWTSSNASIADIAEAGRAAPRRAGQANIRADFGGRRGLALMTVVDDTVDPVECRCRVSPPSLTLEVGELHLLQVVERCGGDEADVTEEAELWSSDPSVIAVDESGQVSALGRGAAIIEAELDGLECAPAEVTAGDPGCSSVVISAPTTEITVGNRLSLEAYCTFAEEMQTVTDRVLWSSERPEVAAVDVDGELTALSPGRALVVAEYENADGVSVAGSLEIEVVPPTTESLSVTPTSTTITSLGEEQQFTATCVFDDGTVWDCTREASWESSNILVATIDDEGLATAVGHGSTEITAAITFVGVPLVSDPATLTITLPPITALDVEPESLTVPAETTEWLTARAETPGGATVDVTADCTWTSADSSVATISSAAGEEGMVTAVGAGATTATCSYGGLTAEATIIVEPICVELVIEPPVATLSDGCPVDFDASCVMSDGTVDDDPIVIWEVDDPSVAVVDDDGVATALDLGTTNVFATLAVDGAPSIVGLAVAVVVSPALLGVTVAPSSLSLSVGDSGSLRCGADFDDCFPSPLDVSSSATWTSADPSIVTVSTEPLSEGEVTAVAVGTTTVTCSWVGFSGEATIEVY